MRINGGHLQKLEVLAATGMPGAYKVLIFFLIQQVYGLNVLGNIASWQSIAQILGFFTAIGWSSLILVRVAKAETNENRIEVFNRLTIMGGVTLLVSIIGAVLCGLLLDKVEDAIQVSYWLTAWTVYQLPRHYLIALKAYRNALYLDAAVVGLSIFSLATVSAEHASLWLALSMLAGGLATLCLIQKGGKTSASTIGYEIQGLEFGLVNFLSGGISLSLIPLAAYFEGEEFAGAVSLFISIAAIALLIPRAISLNQLPRLAQAIDDPRALATHTAPMRRQISFSNVLTSLICLVIGAVMLLQRPETLAGSNLTPVIFLLILQNTFSTQSIVDVNMLMAKEKSRYLLKINIFAFLVFFIITTIMIFEPIKNAFLYICLTITLLNLYRLYKIKRYAKSIHDSHTAL